MIEFIRRNKILTVITSIVLVLVTAFVLVLKNPPDALLKFILEKGISTNAARNFASEDGLYVITTGTGAPLPEQGRASSQTVVIAGDQILVFDAGTGSTLNFGLTGMNYQDVDAMFLTHYHSDHIGDMDEFLLKRWTAGTVEAPLDVYGPVGLTEVLDAFEAAYTLDMHYRVAHHGEDVANPAAFGGTAIEFDLGADLMASDVVYSSGEVEVVAFNVDHAPVYPAVGYRVSYKDRSVVITGDTSYTESLTHHAQGADLLVSEAIHREYSQIISEATKMQDSNLSQITYDIMDYHISPEEVAVVARDAGVRQVLFTHFLPTMPAEILKAGFLKEANGIYDGEMYLANDGTLVKMPTNSDEIIISELLR